MKDTVLPQQHLFADVMSDLKTQHYIYQANTKLNATTSCHGK